MKATIYVSHEAVAQISLLHAKLTCDSQTVPERSSGDANRLTKQLRAPRHERGNEILYGPRIL